MPSTTLFDLPEISTHHFNKSNAKPNSINRDSTIHAPQRLLSAIFIYLSLRLTSSILALVLYCLVGVSDMSNYYNTQSNSALSKFCFTDTSLICALE